MFKKDEEFLGVSLNDAALKIVHLKISPAEKKVVDVVRRDIRDVNESELPNIIQTALGDLHVKKPKTIFALPSNVVTTKNIEIPSLDADEIKSIIDLQAGRHTPYSREEIFVGYITIGVFQRNYTKVLLIIVNRDVIKKQLDIFDRAGLRSDKVLFTPEGMARFYAKALNVKVEDVPVGIIDVAHQSTDFTIEFNQTAATSRSIPIGIGHLIKEGQPAQDKLVDEICKSFEAYQNEDVSKPPEMYVLTSDDAKIKEMQPILQEKLKANVKVMPYLDHISADQQVMLKFISEYNDDSFFDVISAVMAVNDIQVDLTPDEVKFQRTIEEKGRQVVKSGIFAILLLFLVCAIFISKIYFQGVYFNKVKEDYLTKRRAVIKLDRIAQKSRILKDYLLTRMVSLDVINELYALIPDEIYLQSVFLDEAGTINIQGTSESMSRVFNFVTALEESEVFKSVKTKSTSAKKDRGKDVAAFELAFKLESAKEDLELNESVLKEEKAEEEEE